ncbi:MAG: hypothetical protein P1P84_17340 [Deferrisomatales bacterium]|nr:hypothetical protein [Deferrisomatales bacterium]
MASRRMENWDAGEFSRSFRDAAEHSEDPRFREKFYALAAALEPMDREFIHETVSCAVDLGEVMTEVRDIASRMGYCSHQRGFEHTCEEIYRDVDRVVDYVVALREVCFT